FPRLRSLWSVASTWPATLDFFLLLSAVPIKRGPVLSWLLLAPDESQAGNRGRERTARAFKVGRFASRFRAGKGWLESCPSALPRLRSSAPALRGVAEACPSPRKSRWS